VGFSENSSNREVNMYKCWHKKFRAHVV
jgi:hypothetical protein